MTQTHPVVEGNTESVPVAVAGLKVRALVHYDLKILRQLNSPLIRAIETKQPTEWSDEEGYDILLQFTRPVREAAELASKGPEHFRKVALEQIGMRLNPVEVTLLVKAVEQEFERTFSAASERA